SGWLAGEISLEEMWRMVDQIRIGAHGYALVVAPGGELIAHGDPDKKALIAQTRNMSEHPLFAAARAGSETEPIAQEYDDDGRRELGVATRIPQLGWTLIVAQPTAHVYAAAALQRQLDVALTLALVAMNHAGYLFGRTSINPILALKAGTHDIAAGQLAARVAIRRSDELGELGEAFNTMADRLAKLQEEVKRQERQAMFGRVAAGERPRPVHPHRNKRTPTPPPPARE